MQCPNCGAVLPDTATMCWSCRIQFTQPLPSAEKTTDNLRVQIYGGQTPEFNPSAQPFTNRKVILDYLSAIIDVESRKYLQEQLLDKLQSDKATLEREDEPNIAMPVIVKQDVHSNVGGILIASVLLLIGLAAVSTATSGGVTGGMVCLIIGAIAMYLSISRPMANQAAIDKYNERYNRAMTEYNTRIVQYQNHVANREKKKAVLNFQIRMVENGLNDSEEVLKQLYSIDLIYENYRGLANACAMYDYIASGAKDSMKEVYDKLIDQINHREIMTELKEIKSKLNMIIANQRRTYEIIVQMDSKVDTLIQSSNEMCEYMEKIGNGVNEVNSSLQRLESCCQLSTYYNEQIAKQLEYRNNKEYFYNNLSSQNILNLPPSVR